MSGQKQLLLGLIGDNISRSQSPRLHRLAGAQNGVEVRYDRLVPRDLGNSFEGVFEAARAGGYRGLNITYPYKERVAPMVRIEDPLVRAMGSVNTVIFEPDGPVGTSTDYTGFVAAHRAARPEIAPGRVLMIGAGGVGRAVAFGLVALGVEELRLVDRDTTKAEALAETIRAISPATAVTTWVSAEAAAAGMAGLVNCTPVGMDGHPGSPLAGAAMTGADWAFDAVYTPSDTRFLTDAEAHGLAVISGWELFFWQGVHAWKHFSNLPLDEDALRRDLTTGDDAR